MKNRKYPLMVGGVIESFKEEQKKDPELAHLVKEELQKLELAQKLKLLREQSGLSQMELAERVGTKQPAIARLEKGESTPKFDLLLRLIHAMGAELHVDIRKPSSKKKQPRVLAPV